MLRWGDEKTLKFVQLYRASECLWNPRSALYKNSISRSNAYQNLIEHMGDAKLTLKIIRTKIKNLRSAYHVEVKKIKNSGAGYRPGALWFHEMDSFLRDESKEQTSAPTEQHSTNPGSIPEPSKPQSLDVPPSSSRKTLDNMPESRTSKATVRTRKRRLAEAPIPYALDPLQNLSSVLNRQVEYDEFHYFGQNVAAQLRTLSLDEALEVQQDIQAILTEARRRHH